jgi:mannosyltransferase OCH1-like enzyme
MRTRPLYSPVAIACIFFFLVYHLSSIARLFVVPQQQDMILPFELASKVADSTTHPIPKIIHQVFLGFDNSTMPQHWQVASQKCIDLHPDYEYVVRDLPLGHMNFFCVEDAASSGQAKLRETYCKRSIRGS